MFTPRFVLIKKFYFIAPFLAMAKLKQAWLYSSGLTKTFHFMAPFLAMAKLKQAWLCSSGLTKTFVYTTPLNLSSTILSNVSLRSVIRRVATCDELKRDALTAF